MSAVQGKLREKKDFSKSVGFFESEVVAINPSREELEKLLNIEEMERDPEYLKEDEKDGKQKLSLSVWLREIKSKRLFNVRFFLKDEYRTNKTETKNQYINTAGSTCWADDPANLPEWFLTGGREYRKAHNGEEEMYAFVKSWLNSLDLRDPSSKLDFEWKKLMKGNVKELVDCIGCDFAGTVVALATVRTADNAEGEAVDYQQVYNRKFLPGFAMKFLRVGGKKTPKMVTKFIEEIEDPEYGCQEFYGLELKELHEYNPAENIATGNDTAVSTNGPDL